MCSTGRMETGVPTNRDEVLVNKTKHSKIDSLSNLLSDDEDMIPKTKVCTLLNQIVSKLSMQGGSNQLFF